MNATAIIASPELTDDEVVERLTRIAGGRPFLFVVMDGEEAQVVANMTSMEALQMIGTATKAVRDENDKVQAAAADNAT